MPVTSKTGLLPSKGNKVSIQTQSPTTFQIPNIAVPAPFTLRPFAGVYNPFPYGCSILCNHPADCEAKSVVKKAKETWALEGKSLIDSEELAALKLQQNIYQQELPGGREEANVKVPEELFRKYTDTDSRPLTPAPTLASVTTKSFQNLRARRCVTPDPTSFIPVKEKTLLVLDLRRSHSQETVFWQGDQVLETNLDADKPPEGNTSRASSPKSQNTGQPKKKMQRKQGTSSGTNSTIKTDASKDSDLKSIAQRSTISHSSSKVQEFQEENVKNPDISPQTSSEDLDVVKRRGKKRKGKKTGKDGEKEFKGIPDPGMTQVSALEIESREGSSRPSLSGEEKVLEGRSGVLSINNEAKLDTMKKKESFLNRDILKMLQRQLDQEEVDAEFNMKRKIALEEALQYKSNPKFSQQSDEMKILKKEFQLSINNSEKWLSIPRVFTRRSARFELPMDSRLLNGMKPMEYVQKYVFASPERLVLYNHVFNLYREEPEDDEESDRRVLGKNVLEALGKVMGRSLTVEEAREFQNLMDWKDDESLDFRTFTGICCTCERLLGPQFSSQMPSQEEDPRYEVEVADFETLERKLQRVRPDTRLVRILKLVKRL